MQPWQDWSDVRGVPASSDGHGATHAWADIDRLARIGVWTALAIAGRVAFLWAPNIALTYTIVFLAGVIDGRRSGLVVGLLAMTITNLFLSGLHPVLLANGPAMALIGLAGGMLKPWLARSPRDGIDRALQVVALATIGLFATFMFSILSDVAGFLLQYEVVPEARGLGQAAFVPYVMAGLVFNLVPALVNAGLFALVVPATVQMLERAGLAGRARTAAQA